MLLTAIHRKLETDRGLQMLVQLPVGDGFDAVEKHYTARGPCYISREEEATNGDEVLAAFPTLDNDDLRQELIRRVFLKLQVWGQHETGTLGLFLPPSLQRIDKAGPSDARTDDPNKLARLMYHTLASTQWLEGLTDGRPLQWRAHTMHHLAEQQQRVLVSAGGEEERYVLPEETFFGNDRYDKRDVEFDCNVGKPSTVVATCIFDQLQKIKDLETGDSGPKTAIEVFAQMKTVMENIDHVLGVDTDRKDTLRDFDNALAEWLQFASLFDGYGNMVDRAKSEATRDEQADTSEQREEQAHGLQSQKLQKLALKNACERLVGAIRRANVVQGIRSSPRRTQSVAWICTTFTPARRRTCLPSTSVLRKTFSSPCRLAGDVTGHGRGLQTRVLDRKRAPQVDELAAAYERISQSETGPTDLARSSARDAVSCSNTTTPVKRLAADQYEQLTMNLSFAMDEHDKSDTRLNIAKALLRENGSDTMDTMDAMNDLRPPMR